MNFCNCFKKIKEDHLLLEKNFSSEACWKLSTALQEADNELREGIQELTKIEVKKIINKLVGNQSLSSEELEYLKLWIVGDADYYIKMENNFEEWVREVKRLIDEINKETKDNMDFVCAGKIQGMVRDVIRTLGDVLFYLQSKERLEKFKEATKKIDNEERALLIDLLQHKMNSPKV
ncbi:MAG: hypothetical protein PHY73_00515 [Candidatus Omnitrophica bacterium]|nr:hypothetical protein [Candidatus Omnitrophota bacterium]